MLTETLPPFDVVIFVSSEDDDKLVLGGIGTYTSLMCRSIKSLFPATSVYWITQSPDEQDHHYLDSYGVQRSYLAPRRDIRGVPASMHPSLHPDQRLLRHFLFVRRVENSVMELLDQNPGRRVLLEAGEWEGHAYSLFRFIRDRRVLKVARVHTPIATCIRQNKLHIDGSVQYQSLREVETLRNANVVSACTQYVKERVLMDVFGSLQTLSVPLVVLPNPVNTYDFYPGRVTRESACHLLSRYCCRAVVSSDFNVLVVGSVEERKGVLHVMRAVSNVFREIPNMHVIFIGHNGDNQAVGEVNANSKLRTRDLIWTLPQAARTCVSFTGYIPYRELPMILAAGDVFPVSSPGDNFPGVVAEAALSGKPVVALELGGVNEMLLDHESGEFLGLSLGQDIETSCRLLSRHLRELSQSTSMRESVGHRLRSHMLNRYAPEAIVPRILCCYSGFAMGSTGVSTESAAVADTLMREVGK